MPLVALFHLTKVICVLHFVESTTTFCKLVKYSGKKGKNGKMPFKVVQTVEKGQQMLCVVPSLWEKGGTLYWPSNRSRNFKDDSTQNKPDATFKKYQCVVKRDGVDTYQLAEQMMKRMENHIG